MNFQLIPESNPKPSFQGYLGNTAQSPSGTPYSSGYLGNTAQSPGGTPYASGHLFNSAVSPNQQQAQSPMQLDLASLMPSLLKMLGGQQGSISQPGAIAPPTTIPSGQPTSQGPSQVQGTK